MAHPILMPKAGQSMTEGKIVAWLKKEGDPVEPGEPILEVETDKANVEVEAQDGGIIRKILAQEGEVRPILTLVGVIGEPGEDFDITELEKSLPKAEEEDDAGIDAPVSLPVADSAPPAPSAPESPAAAAPPQAATPPPQPAAPAAAQMLPSATASLAAPPAASTPAGRVFASPLARKVAEKRGVDLNRIQGTGPGGRILRRDVESAPTRIESRTDGAGALPRLESRPYPPASPRPPARVPMEGMRKAIGTALQQSKQTIPHFYTTVAIDATAALSLKDALKTQGMKISINDIVLRACAIALQEEPRVNCRVFPDRIEYPEDIHLGVAVGQEEGLVVPVILKAQTRDLAGIAAESRRIVQSANSGKLIGSGQGTFTVSNLGMFGVESFTAIINPPEGAILAVGAVSTEIVSCLGGFLPRAVFRVTLSSDHRAIDGVLAARFVSRVKHLIENPGRL